MYLSQCDIQEYLQALSTNPVLISNSIPDLSFYSLRILLHAGIPNFTDIRAKMARLSIRWCPGPVLNLRVSSARVVNLEIIFDLDPRNSRVLNAFKNGYHVLFDLLHVCIFSIKSAIHILRFASLSDYTGKSVHHSFENPAKQSYR
jgi:hypothetical protein